MTPPEVQVLSDSSTEIPTYDLIYNVDGVAKSESHVLQEGINIFPISETDAAGNQTSLNFSVNYQILPADFYHTTLEAENMQKTTGGPSWDGTGWTIWSNGEIYQQVNVPESGIYEIQVVANGKLALDGVLPLMEVRLDDRPVAAPAEVANQNWQMSTFIFKGIKIPAGSHKISVVFLNDYYGGNWLDDRNLDVDKVVVKEDIKFSDRINGGAVFTGTPNIVLDISDFVTTPAVNGMRFSMDEGQTWSVWENFSSNKFLTLLSGDGLKEVQYQIRDTGGQIHTFQDSITLDTIAPVIQNISIEEGASIDVPYLVVSYDTVDAGVVQSKYREVDLQKGLNTVQITENDAAGNQTQILRHIYYEPGDVPNTQMETFREQLIGENALYFQEGIGIDAATGFPIDTLGANAPSGEMWTQPTSIGFYLQFLGDIITKRLQVNFLTPGQAILQAQKVLTNLLYAQSHW